MGHFVRRLPLLLVSLSASAIAQEKMVATDSYRVPAKELVALADAPLTPTAVLSPTRDWLVLQESPSLIPISDLAQPELRLAGLRFNPRNRDQTRSVYAIKLTVLPVAGGAERRITGLPAGAPIRHLTWSPDGKSMAFSLGRSSRLELWVAGVASARAHRLGAVALNGVFPEPPFTWLPDSSGLICRGVSTRTGPAPKDPLVPAGPVVDENLDRKSPARTYQDLLKGAHDAELLEYYGTARVFRVLLDGTQTPLGAGGLIGRALPSPDGKYLLVETLHRPFSYRVPEYRFPRRVQVWDRGGKLVHQLADLPLADEVPTSSDAVPAGRRLTVWRADAPATLTWVEAQDGGDPRAAAKVRDRLFMLAAPFSGTPVELAALGLRFREVDWGDDHLALVHEEWRKTRQTRTWRIEPARPAKPQLVVDRSTEDHYRDPGKPAVRRSPAGFPVLERSPDGRALYLVGAGASEEGNRPFVDRLDLETLKSERLWRSEPPYLETPLHLLDDRGERLLTRRESASVQPDYFVRDLARHQLTALTHFPHPTPQLKDAKKDLIRYRRAGGVKLTATLHTPPGWSPADGRLPMVVWVYPQEFKSADFAGQLNDSPHRFLRVSGMSPLVWLVRGYAVLDNPSLPIVGEGDTEANDTYVEQLVAGAKAAVDEAVRRGVADSERIAIGGHSYGAFTTANLLAHSDLFRAGIARSGAYNRTLTPFSFQREERSFWEAPATYMNMSPFAHADKIRAPLLLIHGMADNNDGTFPIQSERLFQAMKGLGKTVRLALLPDEAHGYRARESILHMLWECDTWLDRYVKHAPPRRVSHSGAGTRGAPTN